MTYFSESFTMQSAAVRVRFAAGIRHELAEEIARLKTSRPLVLTTPQQADAAESFAELCCCEDVSIFTGAAMHTPVEISERATEQARNFAADVLVAVGGGSTTGLSKAIALRTDLPQIIIPTTYAGSEATAILGQTESGLKTTLTSQAVQPEVILYDPELVATLPVALTVTSALNAMAHAAEGLYARDRSPISSLMAVEGLRAFRSALPGLVTDPANIALRAETLYGAWLGGTVLGQVGMALHHKLCHVLGGSFNLPHAETHAVILPHAIAFNAGAARTQLAPIADLFGDPNPGLGLYRFARSVAAPSSLRDLGLPEQELERAALLATANPYWNPQPFDSGSILRLLRGAWIGEAPDLY
ncbi:maleylacetate reductase [Shinella sp. S4-D37]|uniref:maleylacetate reductase n=1 Tax=Shinella sp. S4-D37 TaxID=3161999 RepID=UPI0034664873